MLAEDRVVTFSLGLFPGTFTGKMVALRIEKRTVLTFVVRNVESNAKHTVGKDEFQKP